MTNIITQTCLFISDSAHTQALALRSAKFAFGEVVKEEGCRQWRRLNSVAAATWPASGFDAHQDEGAVKSLGLGHTQRDGPHFRSYTIVSWNAGGVLSFPHLLSVFHRNIKPGFLLQTEWVGLMCQARALGSVHTVITQPLFINNNNNK